MKLLFTLLLMMISMVSYSQEYVSKDQIIYLFGNGEITTNIDYYFTIKGDYVQQTTKKKLRVINIFDLNVDVADENTISRMVLHTDSETPYLEHITVDLFTKNIAKFIYYLEVPKLTQ